MSSPRFPSAARADDWQIAGRSPPLSRGAHEKAAPARRSPSPSLAFAQTAADQAERAARRRARQRHGRLGHRRGADHRGRPAPGRHRGRGAGARLGGAAADGARLRQRPCRAVRHAGLGARRGAGRDRLALPAAAGRDRARQQRRDAGRAGIDGRGGRLRQRRRARGGAATRRCAARSSSSPTP